MSEHEHETERENHSSGKKGNPLTKKLGPLPVYGWGIAGAVLIFAYVKLHGSTAASTTTVTPATTGALDSGTGDLGGSAGGAAGGGDTGSASGGDGLAPGGGVIDTGGSSGGLSGDLGGTTVSGGGGSDLIPVPPPEIVNPTTPVAAPPTQESVPGADAPNLPTIEPVATETPSPQTSDLASIISAGQAASAGAFDAGALAVGSDVSAGASGPAIGAEITGANIAAGASGDSGAQSVGADVAAGAIFSGVGVQSAPSEVVTMKGSGAVTEKPKDTSASNSGAGGSKKSGGSNAQASKNAKGG